jgi:hypothetical protein
MFRSLAEKLSASRQRLFAQLSIPDRTLRDAIITVNDKNISSRSSSASVDIANS